jgi:hypothetical protein
VATCRAHGVDAAIYALREIDPSEVIFIIGPVDETFPRAEVTQALQALIPHRKVAVGPYVKWPREGLDRLDA